MIKRFVILAVTFSILGCHGIDDRIEERPHGKYGSYYRGADRFLYMPSSPDEYFVVFESRMSQDVLNALKDKGFEITKEPVYGSYEHLFQDGYEVPPALTAIGAAEVCGKAHIGEIPGLIYSCNLYYYYQWRLGYSMTFKVMYDPDNEDDQISLIKKYSEMHGLIPMGKGDTIYPSLFRLLCTNKSAGNVLEMSNWFIEEGGFIHCEPDFMDDDINDNWYDSFLTGFPDFRYYPGI